MCDCMEQGQEDGLGSVPCLQKLCIGCAVLTLGACSVDLNACCGDKCQSRCDGNRTKQGDWVLEYDGTGHYWMYIYIWLIIIGILLSFSNVATVVSVNINRHKLTQHRVDKLSRVQEKALGSAGRPFGGTEWHFAIPTAKPPINRTLSVASLTTPLHDSGGDVPSYPEDVLKLDIPVRTTLSYADSVQVFISEAGGASFPISLTLRNRLSTYSQHSTVMTEFCIQVHWKNGQWRNAGECYFDEQGVRTHKYRTKSNDGSAFVHYPNVVVRHASSPTSEASKVTLGCSSCTDAESVTDADHCKEQTACFGALQDKFTLLQSIALLCAGLLFLAPWTAYLYYRCCARSRAMPKLLTFYFWRFQAMCPLETQSRRNRRAAMVKAHALTALTSKVAPAPQSLEMKRDSGDSSTAPRLYQKQEDQTARTADAQTNAPSVIVLAASPTVPTVAVRAAGGVSPLAASPAAASPAAASPAVSPAVSPEPSSPASPATFDARGRTSTPRKSNRSKRKSQHRSRTHSRHKRRPHPAAASRQASIPGV